MLCLCYTLFNILGQPCLTHADKFFISWAVKGPCLSRGIVTEMDAVGEISRGIWGRRTWGLALRP